VTYRVNEVPKLWRPIWLGYSWLLGLGGWLLLHLLNLTCRVQVEGGEKLANQENFIYALWHEFWFLWFVCFVRSHRRHAWMQHPVAYMKPVHIALQLMDVRVLLGSRGEEGRRAAGELVELLKKGWSTTISPDGPSGPLQVLKKGVLHIALESQVPVLPVRFRATRIVQLQSWDRKPVPLPFSRITVVYGEPVTVSKANFEIAGKLLAERLSGAEA
jgi:lysophospholipid acyltransferase (LPLAT)-like uncharacterized protein